MAENNMLDRDEPEAQAARQVMQFLFGDEAAAVSAALLRDAGSTPEDNVEIMPRPQEEFEAVMAAVRVAVADDAAGSLSGRMEDPAASDLPKAGNVLECTSKAAPRQIPKMRVLLSGIAADAGGLYVGPDMPGRFEFTAASGTLRATLVVRIGSSAGINVRWVEGDRVQIRGMAAPLGTSSVFVQAREGASVQQVLNDALVWMVTDPRIER